MKDAVHVLMEGFPRSIDYVTIKEALESIDGVKMVHSLSVWSLTLDKSALNVHLAIEPQTDYDKILRVAEAMVRKEFEITKTTIQVEKFDAQTMLNCVACKDI